MKRVKRAGWWLLKAAVVLLVVFYAAAGVITLRFGRQVEAKTRAIAARGEPISVAEVTGGTKGPGAAAFKKAAADMDSLKISEKGLDAIANVAGRWPEPLDEQTWDEARQALDRMDGVLEQMSAAAEEEFSIGFGADWNGERSMSALTDLRAAVRALAARGVVRARDGDQAGAAADLEAALQLSQAASPRGAMIGTLVRIACASIACSAVRNSLEFVTYGDTEAARLCDTLEGAVPDDLMEQALLYERAFMHMTYQGLLSGTMTPAGERRQQGKGFLSKLLSLPSRAMLHANEAVSLDAMGKVARLNRRPFHDQPSLDVESTLPRWAVLARMTVPVFSRARVSAEQGRATVEATRALLALARHRADHGEYPDQLSEAQGDGCGFGNDPFSGKPFVYRRQGEGFVLYSLGENLEDDGGKSAPAGESRSEGKDLVWRLTD